MYLTINLIIVNLCVKIVIQHKTVQIVIFESQKQFVPGYLICIDIKLVITE